MRHYVRKKGTPEELSQALSAAGKKNKGIPKSLEARKRLSETRKRKFADGSLRCDNAKKRVVPEIRLSPEYGHWLAGLVDGDGCFYAGPRSGDDGVFVSFQIGLRRDDAPLLDELRKAVGFGSISNSHNGDSCLTSAYSVQSRAECLAIARLFYEFPLRSKKKEDWYLWWQVVEVCFNEYNPRFDDLKGLISQMKQIKHGIGEGVDREFVVIETA